MELFGDFVFGLGTSKGSNTILWNIQCLSFVKKIKNSSGRGGGEGEGGVIGEVQKNMSSIPRVWIFSGIAHFLLLSYWLKH